MEEMANQVDIEKIAIEAMMPKIEEWLNNNLSELVEKIVREEISKIIPQK
jgi:cell pole-organizing protein PopZ